MIYLLFAFMIFLIILGIYTTKKYFNPLTIFNGIWLIIIGLYQFRLSYLQAELDNNTYIVFLTMILSFSIAYLLAYAFFRNKKSKVENSQTNEKELIVKEEKQISLKMIYIMLFIWIAIEIIETIYSGGLPIIWRFIGSTKTYFDYGIPTLHGFTNAFGLVIIMLCYYRYEYTKKYDNIRDYKMIIIVATMLLFYLSLITRQVIISAIIQMLTIKMFFSKKHIGIKYTIYALIGIILFGLVGNIRTGYQAFTDVAMMKNTVGSFFIGFAWIYMYLTMSVSNVNYMVTNAITGLGLYPIAKTFLPTVISNMIFANSSTVIPKSIVTNAFNVSGFFSEFYIGLGITGVIIISALYGLIGGILSRKIQNINQKNILYYAVYMQIILLSFFYNHLLYLPSGFQFIIIFLLFRDRKKYIWKK